MLPVKELDSTAVTYTTAMLHELSFPIHRFGYDHMILAIIRYAKGDILSLTKELYPYIANRFGYADWHAIEHSIRSAIANAWVNGDPLIWNQYFPSLEKAPSNKRVVSRVMRKIAVGIW